MNFPRVYWKGDLEIFSLNSMIFPHHECFKSHLKMWFRGSALSITHQKPICMMMVSQFQITDLSISAACAQQQASAINMILPQKLLL